MQMTRTDNQRKRRQRNRHNTREMLEVAQHYEPRQLPGATYVQVSTRDNTPTIFTTHMPFFNDEKLLTLKYGLDLVREQGMGLGLRTNAAIAKGSLITQYDGVVLEKKEGEARKWQARYASSHYCTTVCREYVVDGYKTQTAIPGDPSVLEDTRGWGGGSFANHAPPNTHACNAELFKPDAYLIFLRALRDIEEGEMIRINYGLGFLGSEKSNIDSE